MQQALQMCREPACTPEVMYKWYNDYINSFSLLMTSMRFQLEFGNVMKAAFYRALSLGTKMLTSCGAKDVYYATIVVVKHKY